MSGLPSDDEYAALARSDLERLLVVDSSVVDGLDDNGVVHREISGRQQPGNRFWLVLPKRTKHMIMTRSSIARPEEAYILRAYANELHALDEVPTPYAVSSTSDVLMKAIAVLLGQASSSAVEQIMRLAVQCTSRMYEGARAGLNLCIELSSTEGTLPFEDFLNKSWSPVLGIGIGSSVKLDTNANVVGLEWIPDPTEGELTTLFAPVQFSHLAKWSDSPERIGIAVTRNGEILMFVGGQLVFARRGTRWHGYPLALLLGKGWIAPNKMRGETGLKRQIMGTLLDVSVAHHGACFGVVAKPHQSSFMALVSDSDKWVDGNLKRRLFGGVDTFLGLSRRHRLELLSMDGATVVSHTGRILTAGAILQVKSGSEGGGRTAAAQALANYGIGIKVSQDGPIRAWTTSPEGGLQQHFAIG